MLPKYVFYENEKTKKIFFFFLILGFHSIHLFSSSKDQVLGPISLVLSCKCRKLLTLLYIIGKLSNYMLYNYMFSSLEMDPGNSFQAKKKIKKNPKQPNKKKSHVLSDISFLCLYFMYEWVSFIYFFLLFCIVCKYYKYLYTKFFVYKLFVIIYITNICIQKYTNIGEWGFKIRPSGT